MPSFATPDAPPLRDLVSKLKSAANPTDNLASFLTERAHFTHNAEQNDQKPHRGIALLQICATESDVDVSEREEVAPQQSAAAKEQDPDSDVVSELLPVVKSENVFGRRKEKAELLSQLVSTNQEGTHHSVITIMGMSGIGKTTLARMVYDDPTVREHFELRAWVKIDGQERDQLLDIAKKLLKSATGMLCMLNNLAELDEMVVDSLLSHRSLIVLDDVESMEIEPWQHMIKSWFKFVGFGSKIIITTSNKQVAETVASTPFNLGELCEDDCWSLYSSLAFSLSKDLEREYALIMAAKRLVARCNGVPLFLKLLGSLMRFEESLVEDLTEIDSSLAISISVLALPQHLFSCFAYCGIFPCGYVLKKEKLIKMWIADGVVLKPSLQGMKGLEDVGEAYFHELLCRSFFTDLTCNEYGDIVHTRMPSVIHEYARKIALVVYKDKVGYALDVDIANSLHFSMAPPFQQVHNNPRNLQTVVSFLQKDLHLTGIMKLSFIELKRLRSLDLSRSRIHKLSKHICTLKKLRYLNLSHTLLTKLPKSFTSLTRLQTLDLSKCYYLKFLPKKMSNLSKLKHLDLSECNSLCCMPFEIGRLTSLVTMPLFVLGDKDHNHANLSELHELNELRGALHIKNLENANEIKEAEAADLKEKKLHNLVLSWSQKVDECHTVLEWLEPNPQLRVLELTGYGAFGFPSWMPNLRSLVKLLINDCRCTKLPTLGGLPHLKELQLKELNNIRSIGKEFYGDGGVFPSLEKLKLHDLPNLNNWPNRSSSSKVVVFPSLKKLSIQSCPELQTLPSLPFVTELVVWRSHSKILSLLTRIRSLSSIVVNNMDVKESFAGLSSTLDSVKKLIVVHSMGLDVLESSHINKFTALQYLRILQCHNLERLRFPHLRSLEKLNVVDCQNLKHIYLIADEFTLTELIIEDCPKLEKIEITTYSGSSLRKLIVRNCPLLSISKEEVQGLEFLFLSRCTVIQEEPRGVDENRIIDSVTVNLSDTVQLCSV